MILNNWINKNGFVYPYGENGIVFSTELIILLLKTKMIPKNTTDNFIYDFGLKVIKNVQVSEKELRSEVISEPWSHDNHTAFVSLSKILNKKGRYSFFDFHKKSFYSYWWRRIHPRDIIYYNYLKGGIIGLFFSLFLPILSVIMILSCRNTTKNIDGDIVQATDTKLLTWIRLNTIKMPLTSKICSWLIRKHFGSWKNVFALYFKDKDHPLNNFNKEDYEL